MFRSASLCSSVIVEVITATAALTAKDVLKKIATKFIDKAEENLVDSALGWSHIREGFWFTFINKKTFEKPIAMLYDLMIVSNVGALCLAAGLKNQSDEHTLDDVWKKNGTGL